MLPIWGCLKCKTKCIWDCVGRIRRGRGNGRSGPTRCWQLGQVLMGALEVTDEERASQGEKISCRRTWNSECEIDRTQNGHDAAAHQCQPWSSLLGVGHLCCPSHFPLGTISDKWPLTHSALTPSVDMKLFSYYQILYVLIQNQHLFWNYISVTYVC